MIANYHTHTWRCNHAHGREEDYVKNGITRGLSILGFSDHAPYIFPGDYYSTFRMRLDQLDDYIDTVLALREQFREQIEIPLGLEIEYYPHLIGELMPVLRDKPIEYLLLGQHALGDEINEHYCGRATDDPEILKRYCYQVMDAVNTGWFTYLAHPDLLNFEGDRTVYKKLMRELCRETVSCGIPVEYNLLGLELGRNYPDETFWQIAMEEGCRVVLGCDAHKPESLLNSNSEELARKNLDALGIVPLETVTLRKF